MGVNVILTDIVSNFEKYHFNSYDFLVLMNEGRPRFALTILHTGFDLNFISHKGVMVYEEYGAIIIPELGEQVDRFVSHGQSMSIDFHETHFSICEAVVYRINNSEAPTLLYYLAATGVAFAVSWIFYSRFRK